jgi:presenilin-like A22 family membrane protease
MKHNTKVTIILLVMFILTQLLGLCIVNFYLNPTNIVPYGFDNNKNIEPVSFFVQLIFSFIIAIVFILFLMKIHSKIVMRIWFFIVVAFALAISFNALSIVLGATSSIANLIAIILGVILSYFKVFKINMFVHNATELLIYPGIASLFVVMLNLPITIILLLIISVYDIWAVWHSKIMMKMAKYQINSLGIFSGFMIPYADKKTKEKIRLIKLKYKNNIPKDILKKSKLKINMAILGGGDIVFSIIVAGVFLKTYSSFPAALIVTFFAILAILYLFIFGEKKKPYPAMPYLTTGILIGMAVAKIFVN